MLKAFSRFRTIALAVLLCNSGSALSNSESLLSADYNVMVLKTEGSSRQEILRWSIHELSQLKKIASRERDPVSGKMMKWHGILLSSLVDKALEKLPVEGRAHVDLVILKNVQGEQALMPRAFISKYPVLLAFQQESSSDLANSRGSLCSVIPWTSKPRILNEDLPLENFFISQINQIELTNYRDLYSYLYLKRRTDPSAMRGEKLFVQNCVSCHATGKGPALSGIADKVRTAEFASHGHPAMKVNLKLSEKDRQSIGHYLEAYRYENSVSMSR